MERILKSTSVPRMTPSLKVMAILKFVVSADSVTDVQSIAESAHIDVPRLATC